MFFVGITLCLWQGPFSSWKGSENQLLLDVFSKLPTTTLAKGPVPQLQRSVESLSVFHLPFRIMLLRNIKENSEGKETSQGCLDKEIWVTFIWGTIVLKCQIYNMRNNIYFSVLVYCSLITLAFPEIAFWGKVLSASSRPWIISCFFFL